MKKLQDKVAVFVGGGSAVATIALKHFMDEGAKVLLVDVDEKYFDRSRQLRDEYPEATGTSIGVCTCQGDMERAMASRIVGIRWIDILCTMPDSHAGGDITIGPEGTVADRHGRDLPGDLSGCARCLSLYEETSLWADLRIFASIGGRANRGVPVTYAGFKAAAIGLTRALALELAADGITVNSMAPASLDTSAFERIPEKDSIPMQPPKGALKGGPGATRGGSFLPDRPVATLDEIAHVIVFMSSDDSAFLTGDCLDVNGGQFMQP